MSNKYYLLTYLLTYRLSKLVFLPINPEQLVGWREQLVLQDIKTGFLGPAINDSNCCDHRDRYGRCNERIRLNVVALVYKAKQAKTHLNARCKLRYVIRSLVLNPIQKLHAQSGIIIGSCTQHQYRTNVRRHIPSVSKKKNQK